MKETTFRLLRGRHIDDQGKEHEAGDVFTSKRPLDKLFGKDKFERVVTLGSQDKFENMTVSQLRAYAEEEEIDLEGATLRKDLLAIIRQAEGTK